MISPRQAHKLGFYRGADGRLHADYDFFDPTLLPPGFTWPSRWRL